LPLHPGLGLFHEGLAVGLVMGEPLRRAQPLFLGLGIDPGRIQSSTGCGAGSRCSA
jgi:hypothetical protein